MNTIEVMPVRDSAPVYEVCPHCKCRVHMHEFEVDGRIVTTGNCAQHGDIVPMRSVVHN